MSSSLSQPQPSDRGNISSLQSVNNSSSQPRTRSGWTIFAATMLLIVGILNLTTGATLINNSDYFVNQLLYGDLTTWGWVLATWGALQVIAGAMSYRMTAVIWPIIGIGLATIAAFLWFFMLFATPAGAILGVAINCLIVYGLSVKVAKREGRGRSWAP